ncbi:hypothetical protein FRB96_003216 [Tulasnella sp. 330]|nr:hypothetical protein FRB96_003216 [Tulasnella sp. 330]KAG8876365.1 hypothetical protein FRB97_004265 [Tulasnella sp. 331]
MASTTVLLNFPSTSDAFSNFEPISFLDDDVTASPPRKAPKLSHTGSPKGKAKADEKGIRRMMITLKTSPRDHDTSTQLYSSIIITRFLKYVLWYPPYGDGMAAPPLDVPYSEVRSACKMLVTIALKGHDVHGILRIEFEKAITQISQHSKGEKEALVWLKAFVDVMGWLDGRVNLIRSVLVDLDCWGSSQGSDVSNVRDLCLDTIRKSIYQHLKCVHCISEDIRAWARWEREHSTSDSTTRDQDVEMIDLDPILDSAESRKTISRLISVLHLVGYFRTHFLAPYLTFTTEFFSNERDDMVKALENATAYFAHCEKRLEEEDRRLRSLVDEPSRTAVIVATEQALLPATVTKSLVSDGVQQCMRNRDVKGLSRMFDLYMRVDALEYLRVAFANYVQSLVTEIVTDEKNDGVMITTLLEEKAFLDKVLVNAFHERPFTNTVGKETNPDPSRDDTRPFSYGARDGFEKGFLARKRKPAEMIAKYIDTAMRKGGGSEPEDSFWSTLDDVLGLYRFTPDKDVFRTFYERGLSKRLLLQKSADNALEEKVINRLRDGVCIYVLVSDFRQQALGTGYDPEFGKGNDMFKDIALSEDLLKSYRKPRDPKDKDAPPPMTDVRMSAMVLKYSTWPFQKYEGTIHFPPEMSESLVTFNAFYKSKHKNRTLEWNHALGTMSIITKFESGEKELSLSLYQGIILLLFQKEDRLSYKDILLRSGLKPKDAMLTLQSLACGRVHVLNKRPPGKDVYEKDEFVFNAALDDKRRNIHISGIQQRETVEETKQIDHAIDQDRQASIDAAIVRIMKSRKKVTDSELKTGAITSLAKHFTPAVTDIKKRIEHLIERDYMTRDEGNHNLYHYVA